MIRNKQLWLPLFIALNITLPAFSKEQTFRLAEFDHLSAAVLPTFTHRNIKWAILSREGYGSSKHTYDSFSGSKDKGETHPVQTAAHEFLQEAILEHVLDWNLDDVEIFIDPKNEYTWVVIAYEREPYFAKASKGKPIRNVTYIVNFNKYKTKLFNKFYDAREQEIARYDAAKTPGRYRTTTEKDRLAKVRWKDLEKAIIKQENRNDPVTVSAHVLDPETRIFNKETITLRPILVMTLRPFLLSNKYESGENEKIRYYNE